MSVRLRRHTVTFAEVAIAVALLAVLALFVVSMISLYG